MQSQKHLSSRLRPSQPSILPDASDGGFYEIYCADAFEWLETALANSIEAVVTDPPYGLIEYPEKELTKLKNGKGGVWRLPPAFDGSKRMPLPRFTVLSEYDQNCLGDFFYRLASRLSLVLVPGGHVFIATNPAWREKHRRCYLFIEPRPPWAPSVDASEMRSISLAFRDNRRELAFEFYKQVAPTAHLPADRCATFLLSLASGSEGFTAFSTLCGPSIFLRLSFSGSE